MHTVYILSIGIFTLATVPVVPLTWPLLVSVETFYSFLRHRDPSRRRWRVRPRVLAWIIA